MPSGTDPAQKTAHALADLPPESPPFSQKSLFALHDWENSPPRVIALAFLGDGKTPLTGESAIRKVNFVKAG